MQLFGWIWNGWAVWFWNAIQNLNQSTCEQLSTTQNLNVLCIQAHCYAIIQCKYNSMTTIQYKNNSVLMLRAGQLGALVKYTSRLEENKLVSNQTNLIHISNK